MILTVGGSPRGTRDGGRAFGCPGRRARGVAGVLRRDRRGACQRSGRVQRHHSNCSRQDAGQGRDGIATVHDSGAERALVADLAHELGVEFADLAPDDAGRHRRHARRRAGGRPTRWTCGAPAPTPATCSAPACARWWTIRPSRSRRSPSTWSPSSTVTPPTPTRSLDVAKHTDAPMAVLASVPSAIDPTTAERLRDSGIPVLEGARSGLAALGPPGALAAARRPGRRRRCDRTAAAMGVPIARRGRAVRAAGRLRRAGRATSDPPTPIGAALAGRRCGRLSRRTENALPPCTRATSAAWRSNLRDEAALQAGVRGDGDSLGSAVTVEPMVEAGVEVSVGIVRDAGLRPAGGRRRGRHPGGVARRPGGGVPAGVARGRAAACSTACASARCWPGGAVQPRGRHRRAGGRHRGVLADGDRNRRRGGRRRGQPGDRLAARRRRSRRTGSGAVGQNPKAWHGTSRPIRISRRSSTGSRSSARRRSSRSSSSSPTRCARPIPKVKAYVRGLQQQIKDQGLWALFLDEELGGPGFGQLKLGLLNEIIGRYPAPRRCSAPPPPTPGTSRCSPPSAPRSRRSGGWSRC